MAKAGFVHSPTMNEPDVARCFFCLIELEGWEPDDDPWMQPCGNLELFVQVVLFFYCHGATLDIAVKVLLPEHKKTKEKIVHFQEELASTTKRLQKYFDAEHGCVVDLEP
ncbi:baculoviral IAP repeat-containing protein 5.1-like [Pleurodeles waltl]|uniref:baculoviral IAP repeat-containing protein 5.1-like n=1 Tax=Pleurodeles waltl TaxID=8319 RepID=UPI0037093CBC